MGIFNWFFKDENKMDKVYVQERGSDFSNFKKVTDFIYEKSGIIDLDKRALTASRLQQYAISEDIYTTNEFLSTMQSRESFYQEVINIATVNETFFLREIKELEWLIEYIKNSNKTLKILSMPSSSGEEIYSILLMMKMAGLDISRVSLTGYDINSNAVHNAIKGEYDTHSLHKVPTDIRDRYFLKNEDKHYEILEEIKQRATFTQENIFNLHKSKEKYDIVLSRNMFIYFDDVKRAEALEVIADLLNVDGIYIKGHADHIHPHPKLQTIKFGIYQKN